MRLACRSGPSLGLDHIIRRHTEADVGGEVRGYEISLRVEAKYWHLPEGIFPGLPAVYVAAKPSPPF